MKAILKIWLALLLFSCTDNSIGYVPTSDEPAEGEVTVKITINTPGKVNTRATRNSSGIESRISTVRVLVFENEFFRYCSEGVIMQHGAETVFEAELLVTKSPVRLYILANADEFFGEEIQLNWRETNVKRALIRSCSINDYATGIPMFGVHTLENGLPAKGSYSIGPIQLLRSVAAMDVVKDPEVSNFKAVSIQAFRAADKVHLIPNDWNSDTSPYVSQPTIPRGTTKSFRTKPVVVEQGVDSLTMYLPESEAAADGEDFTKTTCLVVGGFYGGSTDTTYYRVEIPETQNGGNILRNYRYKFKIIKVSGAGTSTPEEAANRSSTSITAVVTNWEENQISMTYDGDKYFGVSTRKVVLTFRANSEVIDVTTNLTEFKLQWAKADGEADELSEPGTTISDGPFSAEIVTEDGNKIVRVTSLDDNISDNVLKKKFLILADVWKIPIEIEQKDSREARQQYVNILSMTTSIGSFGSTFPGHTNGGDAAAVIKLLNNSDNFGPTGIVPIGFIATDYIVNRDNKDSDMLDYYLAKYDILNLTYGITDISTQLAEAIARWLDGSEHRVLFLTRDFDTHYVEMWKAIYPDDTTIWASGSGNSAGPADFAGYTPANDYFTKSGPFGTISNLNKGSFTVQIVDGTWKGLNQNDPYVQGLAHLLVWNDGRINMAVDTKRRIVYNCDSNIYQYRTTGWNNSGVIDNDKQILLANLFAWAIEEVVLPGKLK